jgi:hypothetical protein
VTDTTKPAVVVVAHPDRAHWADALAAATHAAHICMDDGGALGCYNNHVAAWKWHAQHSDHGWAVVLEDDCLPVVDFVSQLDSALAAAPPAVSIVGLYLGRHRPPQYQIHVAAAVIDAAESNHAWIIADPPRLLNAVAVAIRAELAASMAAYLSRIHNLDIEDAITRWADLRHVIAYTAPSLVDHRDTPSIAAHRDGATRLPGRVAYRTGGRDNWTTHPTVMKLPS